MRVVISEIRGGESVAAGEIRLEAGRLVPSPDSPLLRRILARPIYDFQSKQKVSPEQDPEAWLRNLQFAYRSAYLLAGAPEEKGPAQIRPGAKGLPQWAAKDLHEEEPEAGPSPPKVRPSPFKQPASEGVVESLEPHEAAAPVKPEAPRQDSPEAAAKRAARRQAQQLSHQDKLKKPPKPPKPPEEIEASGGGGNWTEEELSREREEKKRTANNNDGNLGKSDLDLGLESAPPRKEDEGILEDAFKRFGLAVVSKDSWDPYDSFMVIGPSHVSPEIFRDYLLDAGLQVGKVEDRWNPGRNVRVFSIHVPKGTVDPESIDYGSQVISDVREGLYMAALAADRPVPAEIEAWLQSHKTTDFVHRAGALGDAWDLFVETLNELRYDMHTEIGEGSQARRFEDNLDELESVMNSVGVPKAREFVNSLRDGIRQPGWRSPFVSREG